MKHNFKKIFFGLLLIGSLCLPIFSEAATLRAVIFGDTNDELGYLIERGISEMKQEIHTIAAYTDLDLEVTQLTGNDFNSQKILHTLENLKVDEDDVLFLFSFSHGYREHETVTPWPSIHIKSDYWLGEGIDQLLLTEILQEKNPKLLISMFCCCNSFIEGDYKPQRVTRSLLFTMQNTRLMKQNYRRLFLESSGTIIMSSSTPGKYSMTHDEYGEIFLYGFLTTLRNEAPISNLTWHSLFDAAHKKTGEYSLNIMGADYQYYPQIEFINFTEAI